MKFPIENIGVYREQRKTPTLIRKHLNKKSSIKELIYILE